MFEPYEDPRYVGLTCLEDMLVQIDEMGIERVIKQEVPEIKEVVAL